MGIESGKNMFKEARVKLTAWYLLIIMAVSLSFSCVIYLGVNRELNRIANFQFTRIQGIVRGFPASINISPMPDSDAITEARARIIVILGLINLSILIFSGVGGYFLAGLTLNPIAEMVDEQKKFVSNASHELRTPLTALKTEIEVSLRDKKLDLGQAKKMLVSNLEEVDRMQKLSNYLLNLNRYGDEKKLILTKVNLKDVAIRAIGKNKVKTNLTNSLVLGNEESLVELVIILLDNAYKYSPKKDSVEVVVRSKKISVSDSGVGIAKEDLPHIFDRFYRSDKSRGTEGYGLGLSIAKSIVELHNASIKVESRSGRGSTFTITF